jgi:crotonobetainyl-CoA:carnitine CoA-transferase CaiB-like acyl-CoA transferase
VAHVASGGARRDAAAALVRAATQRAAFAAAARTAPAAGVPAAPPLSTDELAALPCGEARRDMCDDMAVVVVFFR